MDIKVVSLMVPLCTALVGCQSGAPSADLKISTGKSAVGVIASIGKAAQNCWFRSGDSIFKGYRMANEINSYAGRPRLLLVPKSNPGGLPSLVIQAESTPKGSSSQSRVQAFGPILSTNNGSRIAKDVERWSKGNSACKA